MLFMSNSSSAPSSERSSALAHARDPVHRSRSKSTRSSQSTAMTPGAGIAPVANVGATWDQTASACSSSSAIRVGRDSSVQGSTSVLTRRLRPSASGSSPSGTSRSSLSAVGATSLHVRAGRRAGGAPRAGPRRRRARSCRDRQLAERERRRSISRSCSCRPTATTRPPDGRRSSPRRARRRFRSPRRPRPARDPLPHEVLDRRVLWPDRELGAERPRDRQPLVVEVRDDVDSGGRKRVHEERADPPTPMTTRLPGRGGPVASSGPRSPSAGRGRRHRPSARAGAGRR